MRILAIDPGTRRIGLALSDELGIIAQPLEFVAAEPLARVINRLREIIAEKDVKLLLVGMPRNMDGTYGPAAQKAREFVAAITEPVAIPIKFWDERLTTAQANRVLIQGNVRREQRKEKVDKTAAAILLQSYLDAVTPEEGTSRE
jgi:putative Holliday junction resolvase